MLYYKKPYNALYRALRAQRAQPFRLVRNRQPILRCVLTVGL